MQKPLVIFIILVALLRGNSVTGAPQSAVFSGPYILGSSVYSARDFAPDIALHIGQPTSPNVLESLRSAIRRRYTRDGFVTPIISIPTQDLQSPNPRVFIHEAQISAIEVRGTAGPYRVQIEHLAQELQHSQPLRKDQVRAILQRISQLPGITSKPLFDQKPEAPNDFVLVLRVEYKPVAGAIELNNAGTNGLGRELLTATLETNNLLGTQEQMHFSGAVSSHPDRYQYGEAQLARRFDNTSIFADISGSKAVPEPDSHFRNAHLSAGLTQQLPLTADQVLSFDAAVNAENASIRDSHGKTWIEDHERNIAIGLTLTQSENQTGRLYLGAERGLNVAGSEIYEEGNIDVEPGYTKYLLQAQKILPFGTQWSFQINLYGQFSTSVLPVLERFTFGGIGFGAAFDPATLSGDSGAEVSAQLARVIHVARWQLQYVRLYIRSDTGYAWNNSPHFYRWDDATSAGGGLTARWAHVVATMELSTPIDQPKYVSDSQTIRTFGSVAYIF